MVGSIWDYDDRSHRVILKADTYRSGRRRKKRKESIGLSLLNRPRLVVLSVVLCVLVLLFLREARYVLANNEQFRIENLVITNLNLIDQATIISLLDLKQTDTLFTYSARELSRRLEADPDIKGVFLEKQFPDTIKVAVTERRPYAAIRIDGKTRLIDSQGVVLARNAHNREVPVITGLRAASVTPGEVCTDPRLKLALRTLSRGQCLGWDNYIAVRWLDVTDFNKLRLKSRERILIVMKRDNLEEQLNKLLHVLKDVQNRGKIIKKIDLRYEDVYVK